ncbi:ubiquinol-cytochrome c reductase iron-sulfur subunit [Oscillatoria amoena NRMC-F 0135]|nr:ubiquinol-cytochrome c reductase iron-sulfur subunit [Oscillatoria amoena NRMC-F 0135]
MTASASKIPDGAGRRNFFVRATVGLGALITAALGLPALTYLFKKPRTISPGGFVDAIDLAQLKPKTPEEVTYQRIRKDGWKLITEKSTAWVVKLSEEEIVAYSPSCTHLGCAYHWENTKKEFVCPCHTTSFALDGRVLGGPAPRPLDRYPVKIQNNRVLIGIQELKQAKEQRSS